MTFFHHLLVLAIALVQSQCLKLSTYSLLLENRKVSRFSIMNFRNSEYFIRDHAWIVEKSAIEANIYHGVTIQAFLLHKYSDKSSSHVRRLVRRGLVYVNNVKALNSMLINIGDSVEVYSRTRVATHAAPKRGTEENNHVALVKVLWEDEHMAVVSKPQGHPIMYLVYYSSRLDFTYNSRLL